MLSLTVTAAMTMVSPYWTMAEPAACLAILPVSMMSLRPANSFSMRCISCSRLRDVQKRAGTAWGARALAERPVG